MEQGLGLAVTLHFDEELAAKFVDDELVVVATVIRFLLTEVEKEKGSVEEVTYGVDEWRVRGINWNLGYSVVD